MKHLFNISKIWIGRKKVCIDGDISILHTKIDTFVCPPHISETVAVRIMKLAHRPRIDSTTITLISKSMSFLSILFKTIQFLYYMLPFPESNCQCHIHSQTRHHCHCRCVSHSSDSLTQSERCSHTYQVPVSQFEFTDCLSLK